MKFTYVIYCCENVSECDEKGFKYIGLTRNTAEHRFNQHKIQAKCDWKPSAFHIALKKGYEFKLTILKNNLDSSEDAAYWEKYYIKAFNTYLKDPDSKGYNSTRGGEVAPDKYAGIDYIIQYSLDGEEIQRFSSMDAAAAIVGVSAEALRNVLNGDGITCAGYQWRFIDDERPIEKVKNGIENIIRSIDQYDLEGKYIRTYDKVQDAASKYNTYSSAIIKVCRRINKTHKGFIWRYSGDVVTQDELTINNKPTIRAVDQYTLDREYITTYESITEASIMTGISMGNISACCRHNTKKAGGFIWEYSGGETKKPKTPIARLDMQGNILEEYDSILDACRKIGAKRSNLWNCLNGKTNSYLGFKWKYL